ncbi:cold shock domain-containing protein [Lactococcus lactis]
MANGTVKWFNADKGFGEVLQTVKMLFLLR